VGTPHVGSLRVVQLLHQQWGTEFPFVFVSFFREVCSSNLVRLLTNVTEDFLSFLHCLQTNIGAVP